MQLICETVLSPRMSVTIIFWTLSSYTLQSIVGITTAIFIPVYLLHVSHVTACLVWRAVKLSISRPPKFEIHLCNAPIFNRLFLRSVCTDLFRVFSIIICSSQSTKLSTLRVPFGNSKISIKYAQNQSITFIFSTTVWNFVTKFSHPFSSCDRMET